MSINIHQGDCREVLKSLPEASVQTCVTSPPYFGLRDYGNSEQIGLEPSPEEFIAALVEVFREVKRVLKDDGTLWLNLGDSYYNYRPGAGAAFIKQTLSKTDQDLPRDCFKRSRKMDGFKEKDLLGIPWSVAKALQEPYYTGNIKDEKDRIWLAAMLDAEGCMFVHKRKIGQDNGLGYKRKSDTYGVGLEIANTSLPIIEKIMNIVKKGSICSQSPEQNDRRKQTIYRWNLRTNESREFVRELYPYLVGKQHQARLLYGCPSSGTLAAEAHQGLINLHRGLPCNIDFPAPASLYEEGYYLRQDIIWSKPNCMPESVNDRCTKSHEYIFLLTKSKDYYFNNEAIKEPAKYWGERDRTNGKYHNEGTGLSPHTGLTGVKRDKRAGGGRIAYEGKRKGQAGTGQEAFVHIEEKRNKRSVWTVTTQPYSGSHFATFPPDLIEPCILAGSAEGDLVLDPFFGAGTTGLVSDRLGRDCIGIELNQDYIKIASDRINQDGGMFCEVNHIKEAINV